MLVNYIFIQIYIYILTITYKTKIGQFLPLFEVQIFQKIEDKWK